MPTIKDSPGYINYTKGKQVSIDTTATQLEASVESLRDTVNVLNDILTNQDDDHEVRQLIEYYGLDEGILTYEVVDEVLNNALEIYGNARVTPDSVDIRSFTVVMGTGGPHIEFIAGYRGTVEIVGYWGSDRTERFTHAPALTGYIADMMGGWER